MGAGHGRARSTRAPRIIAVVAVALALVGGFALGRTLTARASSRSGAAPRTVVCAGERSIAERTTVAACLLKAFLGSDSAASLRSIALPSVGAPVPAAPTAPVNKPGESTTYAPVSAQYQAVVAVRAGSELAPDAYSAPDYGYSAWVTTVIAFGDDAPPLANWYLGHFAVRWQQGRWWLSDAFHADKNATPTTYTGGNDVTAFGPGWVAG